MYERFFSLHTTPFALTPDLRFLFRSKSQHAILQSLLYGITSQKGLIALVGDVGTGKTTLCRALLRELPAPIQSALVLNPHLSDAELVGAILDDLGVERRGSTRGELLTVLANHLLATGAAGKSAVIVLDEAQRISVKALEQVRILSNLETPTRKLVQVVLVGQPELEAKLRRPELRQLNQRIAIRCYLRALSKKETFRYVEHRLRAAGLVDRLPFTRGAMAAVYRHSRGIPRVINLLCDRALLLAYRARTREITAWMVKAAKRSLDGTEKRRPASSWRPALAATLLGAAVAGAVYWGGWPNGTVPLVDSHTQTPARFAEPPVAVPAALPPDAPAPGREGVWGLLVQLLELWGVDEHRSGGLVTPWRSPADQVPEIPAIAARYRFAATFLPETTLAELRAIALPALVELDDPAGRRPYLLRWTRGDALVLLTPSGQEVPHTVTSLEPLWTRSAWVLWPNVDGLPSDPSREMTPTVLATVGLRLHKLGYLALPLPASHSSRLRRAVQKFQRDVGLAEDGIFGPRTTLALSRVVAWKAAPSLFEDPVP